MSLRPIFQTFYLLECHLKINLCFCFTDNGVKTLLLRQIFSDIFYADNEWFGFCITKQNKIYICMVFNCVVFMKSKLFEEVKNRLFIKCRKINQSYWKDVSKSQRKCLYNKSLGVIENLKVWTINTSTWHHFQSFATLHLDHQQTSSSVFFAISNLSILEPKNKNFIKF